MQDRSPVIALTTFSPLGYLQYGKKFLETFVENWPIQVVVYYEELPDFKHPQVIYKPLSNVYGLGPFLHYCDRNALFKGITPKGYDYNFDAAKFCRKVFAQFDVLREYKGKVFWLDGDTFTHKKVDEQWLDDLFDYKCLVYLGREGFHCESGFLGFDTEHRDFPKLFERYENCYRRGMIFKLRRWHDCEALDWAIAQSKVKANNLSSFFKIPKDRKMKLEDLDVFGKSVLGEKMSHLKGNLKVSNLN